MSHDDLIDLFYLFSPRYPYVCVGDREQKREQKIEPEGKKGNKYIYLLIYISLLLLRTDFFPPGRGNKWEIRCKKVAPSRPVFAHGRPSCREAYPWPKGAGCGGRGERGRTGGTEQMIYHLLGTPAT
jgi:hypothetical protein